MKDKEQFHKLVENTIQWALFSILLLILITLIVVPFVLAMFVDWRWIFTYVVYAIVFPALICFFSQGKEADTNNESH